MRLQLGLRLPRPLRLESTLLALTYLARPACVLHALDLSIDLAPGAIKPPGGK